MFDMKVKTLLAVIEAGSYTKAAQKLNLTQPAVSHQIRLLENEFDIKIFYRSKKQTKADPPGEDTGAVRPQGGGRLFQCLSGHCGQQDGDQPPECRHHSHGRRDHHSPGAGHLCNENPDIHINIVSIPFKKFIAA